MYHDYRMQLPALSNILSRTQRTALCTTLRPQLARLQAALHWLVAVNTVMDKRRQLKRTLGPSFTRSNFTY
jgi:hypothetical protein